MSGILNINSIEELVQFLNDKGIMEIAIRNKKKKFKEFQKVALNIAPQGEGRELLRNAVNLMNKNNAIAENTLKAVGNLTKLQYLGLILSAANLCATCIGFKIMYNKLDKMTGQLNQLMSVVKKGQGIQTDYEFNKVLSEHSNMLDARKTQKFYTEEQMRKLVDDEYNVLNMLIDVFLQDMTEDVDGIILSIYSLASMLSVSLRYFDELYYFNNKEAIGDGEVWHSSHTNWMAAFERISSDEFVRKIQDHGIFDLNLSTIEADVYYIGLYDQVKELAEDVEDNQTLIKTLDSSDMMEEYTEYIRKIVSEGVQEAFEQTEGALDNPDVVRIYQDTMKQVALAV
ncbi:hypothetical protein [Butyrivibrio sp. FCS014]|uniref:hypothetical protein n=1 Tax=Butyrivibrio sp. FCS014 TaxID=1408304 RepID=UPI0004662758|nr:hypothetical protein [Butyrivibrio sp. FCS014]